MKYILFFLAISAQCCAMFDFGYKPMENLTQVNASVYTDEHFGIFINCNGHWFEVPYTTHHPHCLCFLKSHDSLMSEIGN